MRAGGERSAGVGLSERVGPVWIGPVWISPVWIGPVWVGRCGSILTERLPDAFHQAMPALPAYGGRLARRGSDRFPRLTLQAQAQQELVGFAECGQQSLKPFAQFGIDRARLG